MGKYTILDGAIGTGLWNKTDDRSPVWEFNFTHPELVKELACEMIDAGADIIQTNTFSANRPSVEHENFDHTVTEIVTKAVELALEASAGRATVSLDIGPLTGMLEPFGTIKKEEASEYFREMIDAGVKAGAQAIFLETFMDLEMMKLAAREAAAYDVPLFCSMSFTKYNPKKGGRTMFGNSVPQILEGLREFKPKAIGMNCSSGPLESLPIIEEFAELSDIPVLFKPNAGTPEEDGSAEFDCRTFAEQTARAAGFAGVEYIGGCCGSTPDHIRALAATLQEE